MKNKLPYNKTLLAEKKKLSWEDDIQERCMKVFTEHNEEINYILNSYWKEVNEWRLGQPVDYKNFRKKLNFLYKKIK